MRIKFIHIIFVLVCLAACVSPDRQGDYVKNGQVFGVTRGLFRGKWWSYYERGISFSDGDFLDEAQQDLETAIAQRDRDQRMARTYGMHFIDYFPHRELGIVLFKKGLIRQAVKELERSLAGEQSAKAKFYLNQARKMDAGAGQMDTIPPEIDISDPTDNQIVNTFKTLITGKVRDNTYASFIAVNNIPEFIELSGKTLSFAKEVDLMPGSNRITITAGDLAGNLTHKQVTIIADYQGPDLSILNFADGQKVSSKQITLDVSYSDGAGIQYLTINGENQIAATDNKFRGKISVPVVLENGKNRIFMEALDAAGNRTKGEMVLEYAAEKWVAFNDVFLNHPDFETATDAIYVSQSENQPGTPGPDIQFKGLLKIISDHQPLTITNKKNNNRFFIEGQVSGSRPIRQITINGVPVKFEKGSMVIFNRLMAFKQGENKFIITATDEADHQSEKSVTVTRHIQQIALDDSKMALSVMPFKTTSASMDMGDSVYHLLMQEIINSERFRIIERGPGFETILQELRLSQTELVNPETAARAGRLLASEAVMAGQIIEKPNDIEIYARLINVETSECIAVHDVYGQDKSRGNIAYLMAGLASKIAYSVPVVEGKILGVKGKKIFIDIGKSRYHNLTKGIRCIVYRTEPLIIDGEILGEDTNILGTLSIEQVNPNFSRALRIMPKNETTEPVEIKKQDLVITK